MTARDPIGCFQFVNPSLDRLLAMDAFAAIPTGHPMIALLELDVSDALAAIARQQAQGSHVSLFAFLVHAIAVAISEHPDLNLVRHGRRMVRFEDVDVSVPVEVQTERGPHPREVVIRRAQDLSPGEVYAQLEQARSRHAQTGALGTEDRWARKTMRMFSWLPRVLRVALIRHTIRSAFRVKARAGTTLVTSVGKFADVPGFAFTYSTGPRAAIFVVGGVSERPWLLNGQVTARQVLSLSLVIDHDLVDGAPAARFATRLRTLIETGHGLTDPSAQRDSLALGAH